MDYCMNYWFSVCVYLSGHMAVFATNTFYASLISLPSNYGRRVLALLLFFQQTVHMRHHYLVLPQLCSWGKSVAGPLLIVWSTRDRLCCWYSEFKFVKRQLCACCNPSFVIPCGTKCKSSRRQRSAAETPQPRDLNDDPLPPALGYDAGLQQMWKLDRGQDSGLSNVATSHYPKGFRITY